MDLESLNHFLEKWEATWLLIILSLELTVSVIGTVILIFEYFWGRPDIVVKNEETQKKRLRAKRLQTVITAPPPPAPPSVTSL